MSYSVYIHTNRVNGKKYVGITRSSPKKRWNNGNGYKNNKHFYSAIKKYGWDNFEHFIVEVDTPEKMYELEKQCIDFYQTTDPEKGYNRSVGGEYGNYQCKNSGSKQYRGAVNKKYAVTHKEELRQYKRDYYNKHKEEILSKSKIYYIDNKDVISKAHKLYRDEHIADVIKKHRLYNKEHREEIKEKAKNYYNSHK